MTEHEKLAVLYTDPQFAIDRCITLYEQPPNPFKIVKPAVARALYGVAGTLNSTLDRVWEVIAHIRQHRQAMAAKAPYLDLEVASQLPLTPLLELVGRLAWHSKRRFVDGAKQVRGRLIFGDERCSFLLSLAGGLKVFGRVGDKELPKPPQSSCKERAREVLEIWADWVINYELAYEAAEQVSNCIKQNPTWFCYPLLLDIARRIEAGEFVGTGASDGRQVKAMTDLSYAMHRLVLGYLPYRPAGVPSQQMRAITALAAIAEADEEAMAAHRS